MFEIVGKFNTAKVFARVVDKESYAQVLSMCNLPQLKDSTIRMMPDMHASEGCTVGTSLTYTDQINPSFVGGDIGCGMQVYKLKTKHIDFKKLDQVIRKYVPSGAEIFKTCPTQNTCPNLEKLFCFWAIDVDLALRCFGTLGGGNHFVEVAEGLDGSLWLIIHSGSRRLGKDIAKHYQSMAFFDAHGVKLADVKHKNLKPENFCGTQNFGSYFLRGTLLEQYLFDMQIATSYAFENRRQIGQTILSKMNIEAEFEFATIHNYVDTKHKILRKGSVSAQQGERLIIPINMKDGSLLCTGKGNIDWNFTAPHGAGRTMKRSQAKKQISMADFQKEMTGIFTTSVSESTLDESPMAYRRIEEILELIEPTVNIDDILVPKYNFKASKAVVDESVSNGED